MELSAALAAAGERANLALGYLYARIGHDCGAVLRGLHREQVSWGTYQDGMCLDGKTVGNLGQYHCNAHSNNFVLRSPKAGGEPLVGFLDLDMAFDQEAYVDLTVEQATPPTHDAANDDGADAGGSAVPSYAAGEQAPSPTASSTHALLLEREYVNLMEVLAGSDASNGVPQVALGEIERQPRACQVAGTALTDTLVLSYQAAYAGEAPLVPFDAVLHRCAHALAQLAVIVMSECEA